MTPRVVADADEAVAGIEDSSVVLVGGFGMAGMPVTLIDALIRQGATDLTVVSNNAGNGDSGLAALLAAGQVRKMVCSFPRQSDSWVFDDLYRRGAIELEVVPQGNLVYRKTARNFGPVMATAARQTVVEVGRVVETGAIDPEVVVTPGIYVDTLLDLSSGVAA